jgi:hypothetical protein
VRWLLDGDPSIRWQAMRDFELSRASAVTKERAKVATEGWGARLLARQAPSGRWANGRSVDGGLYVPKWTSTTYTLLALRDFGLSPRNEQARRGCRLLLDEGLQPDGGVNFGPRARALGRGETCVTGMVLSLLSYFELRDRRLGLIAAHVLREQLADGGWNCRRARGATHSSVHTTISVLEGLLHLEALQGPTPELQAAQRRGQEFLLAHRLFRSHRTGKVMRPEFLKLTFPPRWHYDVLRGLDYFRAAGAAHDPRLADAIEVLRSHQRPDGLWALENKYRGETYFELETVGRPSRWNTLRALRVLRWWG